jgi:putative permease
MKSLVRYSIIVLATLTGLVLLWQLRMVIALFLLSLAVAAAIRPLIDRLTQSGLPRKTALLLAYTLVFGVGLALLILVSGPFINQAGQMTNRLSTGYQQIISEWPKSGTPLQQSIAAQLPSMEALYQWASKPKSNQEIMTLVGVLTVTFDFLAKIALIFILSLYWSADRGHFERLLLSLIAPEGRPQLRMVWQTIENSVGAYIRRELAQIVLAWLLLWLGYQLLGLENPLVLACLGAAVWLIPWFGIVIALIPALLAGLYFNIGLGLLASIYTLLVLACLEWVIEPRIFQKQPYSSIVLMLVALCLAEAFGLFGLILSPLVSASIQIVWRDVITPSLGKREEDQAMPVPGKEELKARLTRIRKELDHPQEMQRPEIISLLSRLEELITEAHSFLG